MTTNDFHVSQEQPKEVASQLLESSHFPEVALPPLASTKTKPSVKPCGPIASTAALRQFHSIPSAIQASSVPGQEQYIAHQFANIPLRGVISAPAPWLGNPDAALTTLLGPCYGAQGDASPAAVTHYAQSNGRKGKRQRTDDESDAEWDNNGEEKRSGNEEHRLAGLRWACPFYKLDSWAHYRCLMKYEFRRVADVKQHIIRCHALPGYYYCAKCWLRWKSEKQWSAHMLEDSCTAVLGPESLNEAELATLDQLPQGRTNSQKWYSIWNTFFKGHEPPDSPHVQSGISETISLLSSHAMPILRSKLPSLLQNCDIQSDGNALLRILSQIEDSVFQPSPPPKRSRLYPVPVASSAVPDPGFHPLDAKTHPSSINVLSTATRSFHGEIPPELKRQLHEAQHFLRGPTSSQLQQQSPQPMRAGQTNAIYTAGISPAHFSETMTPVIDPALESMHEPACSPPELDLTSTQIETVSEVDHWGDDAAEGDDHSFDAPIFFF